jgi:hypothetical protein
MAPLRLHQAHKARSLAVVRSPISMIAAAATEVISRRGNSLSLSARSSAPRSGRGVRLAENHRLRTEDVLISLVEGRAQYVKAGG